MKTYNNLYNKITNINNLILAWKKARKGKAQKDYVIEFEKNLKDNLLNLQKELKDQTYRPKPLTTFILRDPKTRKISKSDFRDRIIHHAIVNIIEPIFDKTFIHDSCANRKGRGNLFAIKRFDKFKQKVSHNGKLKSLLNNNQIEGYCLKADIKHYFEEVGHNILLTLIGRKIKDEQVLNLIEKIVAPNTPSRESNKKGMPLGNLTSQFFANIYLNELDYFVKHTLKIRYYVRYVDDFIILNNSKSQLNVWKNQISIFLRENLKLELHPEKSKIIPLSKGIDFVGFRNFYRYKLIRKRTRKKMFQKINRFNKDELSCHNICEIFQGWQAHAKWSNSFKLRKAIAVKIVKLRHSKTNSLNLKTPFSLTNQCHSI